MWATTYITVAFVAPTVGGAFNSTYMLLYGAVLIACVAGQFLLKNKQSKLAKASKIGLFAFAIAETIGGVMSFTGALLWNVPFANTEVFQVSMAFMDLVSATMLFYVVFEQD
jgi:hypothetical protein